MFISRLAEACQRFDAEVHAYCLMSNHFHLLLHCPELSVGPVMHRLGGLYTQWFNDRYDLDGRLFRNRFWSDPIADDRHLLAVARYIDRNPLAFLAVDELPRYPWSSLGVALGTRRSPSWLNTGFVTEVAGGTKNYGDLVAHEHAPRSWPEVDRPRLLRPSHPLEQIVDAVLDATGAPREAVTARSRGQGATVRHLVALLAGESPDVTSDEVAARLELASGASARNALRAARKRLADPQFAATVRWARARLGEMPYTSAA